MSVQELIPIVRQLARLCERQAYNWTVQYATSAEVLAADMPDIVSIYCESAALLAADWYNDQEADSSYFATPFSEIDPVRISNTAYWAFEGPQRPENKMMVAAHSMVFDAVRNTVMRNSENEGVALVRHEEAGCCSNCAVRATSQVTDRNTGRENLLMDFHHSCEGLFVPVRAGVYQPPEYAISWGEKVAEARLAGKVNADDIAKWIDDN